MLRESLTGRTLVFSMPFREKHSYTDVFYTPPDAVAAASWASIPETVSHLAMQESVTRDNGG